jgi:hypothetical protein
MSRGLSSSPMPTRNQPFIQSTSIKNASHEIEISGRQSKIQRWIFGMIIGSAPFLIILFCWMFVSLCINNFVRFYRLKTRTNGTGNIAHKIHI